MKKRNDHIIPRVYLRKWSRENDHLAVVPTNTRPHIKLEPITSFLAASNVFDIYFGELHDHNDKQLKILEDKYNTFVRTIANQKRLVVSKWSDYLASLVATFIVRSEVFRTCFDWLCNDEKTRNKLIHEIHLFRGDKRDSLLMLDYINESKPSITLFCDVAIHFSHILRQFDFCFLRPNPSRGQFITSDTPVVLHGNTDEFSFLIPTSAELFLPLSPDLLCYLTDKRSEAKKSDFASYASNKTHIISEETVITLNDIIAQNALNYIILPPEFKAIEDELLTMPAETG